MSSRPLPRPGSFPPRATTPQAGEKAGPGPDEVRRREQGRILVFVVAYHAERNLVRVFERIPEVLFSDPRIHFLVIDDASADAGPELLRSWVAARGLTDKVTITANTVNQGYGGNQKLGYRLALEAGFDLTILLHGDGQYAPELLPRFIEAWQRTGAGVVLGTRMASLKSARAGGMPLYKIVGNRFLTFIQNRLTGAHLSEYHTGYRAYSSDFLRKVPFEIDTNDFHFDTEILLQAIHVGESIEEFAIPTHYGDEVCHVDGLAYARNVTRETLRYRLHRIGMLCSLKYRNLEEPALGREAEPLAYAAHRMAIRAASEVAPRRLADLGCGSGAVARYFQSRGVQVTAIDRTPPDPPLPGFQLADLEDVLPIDCFEHDVVLLLDVLEELGDPERFLLELRNRSRALRPGDDAPLVVVTTPNVAFLTNRLALLFGRFNYGTRGILDIAHKRLLNRVGLRRMLRDCGYRIERIEAVPIPWVAVLPGRLGHVLERVSALLARLWGSLFGFQFLVLCRPLPGVAHVLGEREGLLTAACAPAPGAGAREG